MNSGRRRRGWREGEGHSDEPSIAKSTSVYLVRLSALHKYSVDGPTLNEQRDESLMLCQRTEKLIMPPQRRLKLGQTLRRGNFQKKVPLRIQ